MQSLAPWNPAFSSALSSELENSPFATFNFASAGLTGWPSSRCCVLRGFLFDDRSTNVLIFSTDRRSLKCRELARDSRFEACFYFGKARKQFRLRGHAQLIAQGLNPNIVVHQAETLDRNMCCEENDSPSPGPNSHLATDVPIYDAFEELAPAEPTPMSAPLEYMVISPAVKAQESMDASYTSLADVANRQSFELAKKEYMQQHLKEPTPQEWADERARLWAMMSRNAKKSFKHPLPGSLMTRDKRKLLDSIGRNVDGTTSSSGYENFAVVCLFVEMVDYLALGPGGANSRYVYKRVDGDNWKEYEVCP